MLKQLLAELKASARLRMGVALVAAVVWLYAILLLQEARNDLALKYRGVASKTLRLQSVLREGDWTARLDSAKTLQAEMEGGLWRGDTVGLARASFQDWLNQEMQHASVTHPNLTMSAGNEVRPDSQSAKPEGELWKVGAKLVFDFNPDSLNKLLGQLAGNPHHVIVESLHVTKEPNPRVELMVLAYFQPPVTRR